MREFNTLPDNGFYVVLTTFSTENVRFMPGEPVALVRMGSSPYVLIIKTSETFGGWANYMEVESVLKLKKLSFEEVSELTNGRTITADMLQSRQSIADACKAITGSVTSLRKTLRDYRQKCRILVKLPDGREEIVWLLFRPLGENIKPIEDRVYLYPLGRL